MKSKFKANEIVEVILDPLSCVNYASYYIYGIRKLYPNARICWASNAFSYQFKDKMEYWQGIGIIFKTTSEELHVYIDFHDSDIVLPHIYDWSDIYGKINVKEKDLSNDKIVPIGPSFGIIYTSRLSAAIHGFLNYLKIKKNRGYKPSFKEYIKNYFYPFFRRIEYKEYLSNYTENPDYIFATSTLWYQPKADVSTNLWRANFSKLCKKIMPQFEGGLFYIKSTGALDAFPNYDKYKTLYSDIIISRRVTMSDYIKKTKKSAMVFNTPSVLGCHGWKLGEYLALGKSIISTPLENVMPGQFRNGIEYLEVKTFSDLERAIIELKDNPQLRESLKSNARSYFNLFLSPTAVIERLISIGINKK